LGVTLGLRRTGSPPNLVVEIRGVTVDDKPNSTVFATQEYLGSSSIPDSFVSINITFDNPPNQVSGNKYSFVVYVKGNGGDSSNYYRMRRRNNDVYANGRACLSSDGGSSWTGYSQDVGFITWVNESTIDGHRIEVWHNSTVVSYSGILNSVSATLNFTTTQDDIYSLQIYNWVKDEWEQTNCDSGPVTANTATQWWCNKTSSPINYISPDKKIRIRINSTQNSDQGTLKEDYVQYYVDYTEVFTYDCTAVNVSCTLTTVTFFYQDGSAMTINYQKPVNFFNETLGDYQQISQSIVVLPSSHPAYAYGYRYGVDTGVYQVGFKDDIGKKWEVAFNISNLAIITDLQRVGYLDYSDMSSKTLQSPSTTDVTLSYNQINYTGIFTGIDIRYTYLTERLKEDIILNQTFRDSAPDPNIFGMNPATTYLVFETELDYRDLSVFVNDTKQTGNFTSENRIEFKDALGDLKMFVPVAYAVDSQRDELGEPNNTQRVRWRLVHYDSDGDEENEHFLYYGIPVTWLSTAQYPVMIDPSNEFYFEKEIDNYPMNNTLDDYYFNASSAVQMTNDIQNYWTHNEMCLRVFVNRWYEYCGRTRNFIWYNSTDFSTYVNLTGITSIKRGNYSADINLEFYLESDRNDIRITPTIKNTGKDVPNLEFKTHIHDIKINNTYENDTFFVVFNVSGDEHLPEKHDLSNSTLNLTFDQSNLINRSSYLLDFPDSNLTNYPDKFGRVIWNESKWVNGIQSDMDYRLEVEHDSEYNVPVNLILELGSLNENDIVTTNLYWIDAASTRYNKTLSRLYESPWKIVQFFDSNLSRLVEGDFDKDVYSMGENYTLCFNSSGYEKTANAIYYGWLKKVDEPTGIKGYFSGTRKVNKSSNRECFHGKINVNTDPSTAFVSISSITSGKYMAEAYFYVYEPNEHYFMESELFEITG